jgi:hypothetical protein
VEPDQRSLVEEAADAGVLAYLMKPVRESEIPPAIEVARARFAELRCPTAHRGSRDLRVSRPSGGDRVIHRSRHLLAFVSAGVLVALGTAACSRADERTRAIDRLREIDRRLTDLDQAYRAGKKAEAREIATKIFQQFDESVAERVLTRKDRPLKHELEPILEHKIRDKLEANAPLSEVTELIARAPRTDQASHRGDQPLTPTRGLRPRPVMPRR